MEQRKFSYQPSASKQHLSLLSHGRAKVSFGVFQT
jgi:hypothetical protein